MLPDRVLLKRGLFLKSVIFKFLRPVLPILLPFLEVLWWPLTVLASFWLLFIRRLGISRQPLARKTFRKIGVYPVRDHYYEPLFNTANLRHSLRADRVLPGIDWNLQGQRELLKKFQYQNELKALHRRAIEPLKYNFGNDTFRAGDSEFLYSLIRTIKPRKIIEIGSGNSTLMSLEALQANRREDAQQNCDLICIEPFERPWLEKLDIKLERRMVEDVDIQVFKNLSKNDILFIDSSHMMRPQGDVLTEYLRILPEIQPGVWVHVHDIFSPKDYLTEWIEDEMKFWNEQYLLEAFLSMNPHFKVVGALNYLKNHSPTEMAQAFPVYASDPADFEPGSFWLYRV